jgi:hypothetical protein
MKVAPTMQNVLWHEIGVSGARGHHFRILVASSRWEI